MKRLCWLQNWEKSAKGKIKLRCGRNEIKMQAGASPKRAGRGEKKDKINAVIHENDLQNGTRKKIKLWAWLGNPWILPGSNNGSTGAHLSNTQERRGARRGHCMEGSPQITDDMGRLTFLPRTAERSRNDLQLLLPRMWPLTFLTCFVSALEPPTARPMTTAAPALTNRLRAEPGPSDKPRP